MAWIWLKICTIVQLSIINMCWKFGDCMCSGFEDRIFWKCIADFQWILAYDINLLVGVVEYDNLL
jgi:hypothetical protein